MSIGDLLNIPSLFTLLVAPPAWGKTRRLVEWYDGASLTLLVYISPLRALADEVEQSFSSFDVLNLKKKEELVPFLSRNSKRVLIITPERFNGYLHNFLQQQADTLIFLDEFHLFYRWSSFRPKMWECLEEVSTCECSVMAVTATMSCDILADWQRHALRNFEQSVKIDVGNYALKNYPVAINMLFGGQEKYIWYLLFSNRSNKRTVLCFCRYRNEVKRLTAYFKLCGVLALGCVGGETDRFLGELSSCIRVDIIFSTIALGHGVNLPDISDVMFTYKEDNRDYFLQMVARAGRRGERFSIWIVGKFNFYKIKSSLLFFLIFLGNELYYFRRSYYKKSCRER